MSAITLKPIEGEEYQYKAMFHFLNIGENTGLYVIFSDKLFHMWNALCDRTNGEDGVIAKVNAWAKENGYSGTDREYIHKMNGEYAYILDELCDKEEYKCDIGYGNKLKMRCILDIDTAGEFDVEIVAE